MEKDDNLVFLDFLTFTTRFQKLDEFFEAIRIPFASFEYKVKNLHHYTHSLNFGNAIYVNYCKLNYEQMRERKLEHTQEMHEFYVQIGGKGIRTFKEITFGKYENIIDYVKVLEEKSSHLKYTRVDFTKDDRDGNLHMEKIHESLKNGEFVSRMKDFKIHTSMYDAEKQKSHGYTIYLGSRKNEFMLRIYNKSGEEFSKFSHLGKEILDEHRIRVEMEFRKDQAHILMKKILETIEKGESVGELYSSLLLGKIKILRKGVKKEQFHKKLDRIMKNLDEGFERFVETTKVANLGVERHTSNFLSRVKYIEDVSPRSLASFAYVNGEEAMIRWILELAEKGKKKLRKEDYIELETFKNQQKEKNRNEFGRFADGMDEFISDENIID